MARGPAATDDRACLLALAQGRGGASDAHAQTAAITLYNARSAGWEGAVEDALAHGNANAPLLNLAGIKRAFNRSDYPLVLTRAQRAWSGAAAGYTFTDRDAVYVFEHACRAAHQMQREGRPSTNGIVWCERWLDRVRRSGGDVAPIQRLLDELE